VEEKEIPQTQAQTQKDESPFQCVHTTLFLLLRTHFVFQSKCLDEVLASAFRFGCCFKPSHASYRTSGCMQNSFDDFGRVFVTSLACLVWARIFVSSLYQDGPFSFTVGKRAVELSLGCFLNMFLMSQKCRI
jgi:hypothetical protein